MLYGNDLDNHINLDDLIILNYIHFMGLTGSLPDENQIENYCGIRYNTAEIVRFSCNRLIQKNLIYKENDSYYVSTMKGEEFLRTIRQEFERI